MKAYIGGSFETDPKTGKDRYTGLTLFLKQVAEGWRWVSKDGKDALLHGVRITSASISSAQNVLKTAFPGAVIRG